MLPNEKIDCFLLETHFVAQFLAPSVDPVEFLSQNKFCAPALTPLLRRRVFHRSKKISVPHSLLLLLSLLCSVAFSNYGRKTDPSFVSPNSFFHDRVSLFSRIKALNIVDTPELIRNGVEYNSRNALFLFHIM